MRLICGMHRTGSSLVARLAAAGGGEFGDPSGFHAGDKWNPEGYYEQEAVIKVNLRLINGPWGRLSYAALPSEATLMRRGRKHAAAIRTLVNRHQYHIVKENRFCITLPVWRRFGADIEKVAIIFRDPLAVARSLRRRNGLPIHFGLFIWFEHYERLLRHVADTEVLYIWYDRLVSDPDEAVDQTRRLYRFLGLNETQAAASVAQRVRFSERSVHGTNASGKLRSRKINSMYRHLMVMQSD